MIILKYRFIQTVYIGFDAKISGLIFDILCRFNIFAILTCYHKTYVSFMPKILTAILLCVLITHTCDAKDSNKESLKTIRDYFQTALSNRQAKIEHAKNVIDSLKQTASTSHDKCRTYENIAVKYTAINLDSAFRYYDLAINNAKDRYTFDRLNATKYTYLPIAGRGIEALDGFNAYYADTLPPEHMLIYHRCGERLYHNLSTTATDDSARIYYARHVQPHSQALMADYPVGSILHNISSALYYKAIDKPHLEEAHLNDVINSSECTNKDLSEAALQLAHMRLAQYGHGDDQALQYLYQSAIAELEGGIATGSGLPTLAIELWLRGESNQAYAAMLAAMDNGVASGAHSTLAALASYSALAHEVHAKHLNISIAITIFILLASIMATAAWFIIRKKLRQSRQEIIRMENEYRHAGEIRHTHAVNFLNLYALCTEKTEEILRVSRRKLSAGQIESLHTTLKSTKILDEQTRLFYDVFDNTVIDLIPDFVEEVNSLLQPDKRIATPAPRQLTMELRILAFSRLGIEDTALVARFLRLSLNTIYTYRNKLRSRAIDRDGFDEAIKHIGTSI